MKQLNVFEDNERINKSKNLNVDKFLDTEINNVEDFLKYLADYTLLKGRDVSDCFEIFDTLKNICEYKPIIKDVDKYEEKFDEIYWEYIDKYENNKLVLDSILHSIHVNNSKFRIICEHIYSCCYEDDINIYLDVAEDYTKAVAKSKEIKDTLAEYLNAIPFSSVVIDCPYNHTEREQGFTQCELIFTLPKTSDDYIRNLIEDLSKIYKYASFEKFEVVRDPLKIKFN